MLYIPIKRAQADQRNKSSTDGNSLENKAEVVVGTYIHQVKIEESDSPQEEKETVKILILPITSAS